MDEAPYVLVQENGKSTAWQNYWRQYPNPQMKIQRQNQYKCAWSWEKAQAQYLQPQSKNIGEEILTHDWILDQVSIFMSKILIW